MTFDMHSLIRENIRKLKPYSSARSEFAGEAEVFLDANENAFGSPAGDGYNRYPDPLQIELKHRIALLNGVTPERIFVGNGSDEVIDLLFRIFCKPGKDEVIICPPTYGMYRVSADINDIQANEVRLTDDFQLDVPAILLNASEKTKLIFICSPNNPTGNLMRRESIIKVAEEFNGIVVVDEAYIHFADTPSMVAELQRVKNLVVLQTFSKAWGMAGLRVGLAFADEGIIGLMNSVKPPYNVSSIAQAAVIEAFGQKNKVDDWVQQAVKQRKALAAKIGQFSFVRNVYPSDANFVLVRTVDADVIYQYLVREKIVVRNRNNVELCEDCLRITVGTPEENDCLTKSLARFEQRAAA
ncbi:MAG: histidinol-phosphate transaminase [Blastocatellia bacterium]